MLTIPHPYRRWFHRFDSLSEDQVDAWQTAAESLVTQLATALSGREAPKPSSFFGRLRRSLWSGTPSSRSTAFAEVQCWSADQSEGTLALTTLDQTTVTFRAVIVGTHDGQTFKWSWHNPSITRQMQPDRAAITSALIPHDDALTDDRLPITRADAWALTGAAGAATGAKGAYIARAYESTLVFFLLHEVTAQGPASDDADMNYGSPLNMLADLLQNQSTVLDDAVHREAQKLANEGRRMLLEKRPDEAYRLFAEAWAALQNHKTPWDTPMAGYVRHGMAEARFALGEFSRTRDLLAEAVRKQARSGPLSRTLNRLGQAQRRAGDSDGAADAFLRAYVLGSRTTLDGEDDADRSVLEAKLATLNETRQQVLATVAPPPVAQAPQEALAVVAALGRDLSALNTFALEGSERAEALGEDPNTSGAADHRLKQAITRRWCELVATWCTPGKVAHLSHYGSRDPHNPAREFVTHANRDDQGRLEVWTQSLEPDSDDVDQISLYLLVEHPNGWWVEDAWMVFDPDEPHEERYTFFG